MRATAAPVDGNRVRLSVEIDESEVDEALDATAKRLSRQVKIPGFRPGRVPRRVLEARMGGAVALRQQALSDVLPDLYARAVQDTDVDPIAPPDIDITSGEDDGPVTFDAVVEVRPTVSIPGYAGLVVTVPRVEVTDDEVEAQLDRLREQTGELATVTRPASDGDYATIDLHGARQDGEDLDVQDYLYEIGSGSDVAGLDDQLRGSKTGDILQFSATFPAAPASGGAAPEGEFSASIRVLVKEVKEKVLPDPTDEWAAEASEFDTVAALRDDVRTRLTPVHLARAQMAFREQALEALVALVQDEPPEALVETEVRERLHDLGHRLETRGLTLERFLQAAGRDEASLLAEIRDQASQDVQADLALRALADAESLDVSDDELEETLADMAEQMSTSVVELRRRLDRTGRLPAVRSDRRKAKALVWLLDHVEVVDEDGATVDREVLRNEPGAPRDGAQPVAGEAQAAVSGSGEPEDQGSEDVQEDGAVTEEGGS
jgi:trigger factor